MDSAAALGEPPRVEWRLYKTRGGSRSEKMKYVVVYKQTPNNWSAYVPDLPGCVAAGDTREEVEWLIREAVELHMESLREHGQPMPPAKEKAPPKERRPCKTMREQSG